MPRRDIPPIREDAFDIEIDQRRNRWPFIKAMWGPNVKGRTRLLILLDTNEGGQVVGEGANIAMIALSKKKARRLAKWILKTVDEVPDSIEGM